MTESALGQATAEAPRRASRRARLRTYGPALGASLAIGIASVGAILGKVGHPAMPLDDAFIHLQYARRLAEGTFFEYVRGEGYTTGATSLLWPLLLAPFYKIGFRDLSLVYVVWLLGGLAHAGVAVETARLAERLAGRAAAVAAGAMCLVFGAFAWFAWSGMETLALAWILLRTARVGAEWCEASAAERIPSLRPELVALGLLAPLVRPEGIIASLIAAAALGLFPRARGERALAALPLLGPLVTPLLHLALAGHAASSTTLVKWLLVNPYYSGASLSALVASNARLLVTSLLDGGDYTAVFLPEGSALPILLGAVALAFAGCRRSAYARAAFTFAVALGTLLPCTYLSFLWNRVRYIWPFAGAWFVMLACLARELGDLARRVNPRLTFVTPAIAFGFVGALATKLPWTVRDLAQSASAIDRQQVTLGRWVDAHLPPGARVGVNDTGAIAYFGERKTFDVVGLTTEGEARYWVAGAGSRFEHYEHMDLGRLPTHFVVYPQWMACAPVLGAELTEATVLDQSILGGQTMIAYEARWDLLGSGKAPLHPHGELVDEIDVADLESESAHAFDVAGASDADDRATILSEETETGEQPAREVADGFRANRTRDRFVAALTPGQPAVLVLRVAADDPAELTVAAGGRKLATIALDYGWSERSVAIPADAASDRTAIDVVASTGHFSSFHYWLYR